MDPKEGLPVCEPVGKGGWEAHQGDCVYSIAAKTGHRWQTLWEHPQNETLRKARKTPGILLPGDHVYVPERQVKSVLLASGQRHRIVVEEATVMLRLRMGDADGRPMAKTDYRLEVAGQVLPVTTDDDGTFAVPVPSVAEVAHLVEVATGETVTLHIGHMDPTGSSGAVRKRLANLGYTPDAPEGPIDEHVQALLAQFIEDAELDSNVTWDELVRRLEAQEPWPE